MRKKVFGRQLSRSRKAREALFRNLIRALILQSSIKTTKAKAKAIVGEVDKLITRAKKNTVASQRLLLAKLGNDRETLEKLLAIAKIADKRSSGYTRSINLPRRVGDLAQTVRIEFVDKPQAKSEK